MNKKIIILSFLLSGLLLMIPYAENVKGSVSNIAVGFNTSEGGMAGSDFPHDTGHTSILHTKKTSVGAGRNFQVTTASKRTGDLGFFANYGEGFFNFSYTSNFLTGFRTFIDLDTITGLDHTDTTYFLFFNKTIRGSASIGSMIDTSAHRLLYFIVGVAIYHSQSLPNQYFAFETLDSSGTWTFPSYLSVSPTGWDVFSFNITSDTGLCEYRYNFGSTSYYKNDTACNNTQISEGYKIDSCYVMGGQWSYTYIDDVNITMSDTYNVGSDEEGCLDVSDYTLIGDIQTWNYVDVSEPGIRVGYWGEITADVKAIVLSVNEQQLNFDDNLANYSFYYGSTFVSNPVCSYSENGIGYLMFDVDIELTNEQFTDVYFWHSVPLYGSTYWQLQTGAYDEDLNGDGEHMFFSDDTNPSTPYVYWWGGSPHYDVAWGFYIDQGNINPPPVDTYNDTLGCSGYEYMNTTGYVYDVNKPIILDYTLHTTEYNYQVNAYHNGTFIWDLTFPFNCVYPSGNIIYYVTEIGKYNFTLDMNIIVPKANLTTWVVGTEANYRVWSAPASTFQFASYNVHYKYYNGVNDGIIACFSSLEDANDLDNAIFRTSVEDNTDGSFTYSGNTGYEDYWRLFVNNSYNTPVGEVHIHYMLGEPGNTITVQPENLKIKPGNPDNFYVRVDYTHLHPGSDVKIRIGSTVYDKPMGHGTFTYIPKTTGTYTALMYINQNGTIQNLASDMFTVTLEGTGENNNETGGQFDLSLDPPLSYIVGSGLIVFLMILPIFFSRGASVEAVAVAFISFCLGVIGAVIDILLGYFPAWVLVVMIAVPSLIVVIMWLRNKIAT